MFNEECCMQILISQKCVCNTNLPTTFRYF